MKMPEEGRKLVAGRIAQAQAHRDGQVEAEAQELATILEAGGTPPEPPAGQFPGQDAALRSWGEEVAARARAINAEKAKARKG
jgi:hypothetical protein